MSRQRTNRTRLLASGLALAAVLAIASCGSDDDPDTGAGAATDETTDADTAGTAEEEEVAEDTAPVTDAADTTATADSSEPTGEAPASDLAALEAAAEEEGGELLWYLAGADDLALAMKEAFEAKYPWATVTTLSAGIADLNTKLVTEATTGAPTADLVMVPGTLRQTLLDNGIAATTEVAAESAIDPELLDPTSYAHPFYLLLLSPVYNTDLVAEPPSSPEDLGSPEWADQIAFDRPQARTFSLLWLSAWKEPMGEDAWLEWLDGIQANNVFITNSGGDTYAAVLRGERGLGIGSSNDILAQEPGAPMAAVWDFPPVPFVQNLWLTSASENQATVQLFLEWALSPEGQQVVADTGRSPVLDIGSDLNVSNILPDGVTLVPGSYLRDVYDNLTDYSAVLEELWPS